MIAKNMNGVERHQHVHGTPRVQRPACHVAEIDDVVDPLRTDIRDHRFQREIISVYIRDRGKTHHGLYVGA